MSGAAVPGLARLHERREPRPPTSRDACRPSTASAAATSRARPADAVESIHTGRATSNRSTLSKPILRLITGTAHNVGQSVTIFPSRRSSVFKAETGYRTAGGDWPRDDAGLSMQARSGSRLDGTYKNAALTRKSAHWSLKSP